MSKLVRYCEGPYAKVEWLMENYGEEHALRLGINLIDMSIFYRKKRDNIEIFDTIIIKKL